jgi:hypothetical protein
VVVGSTVATVKKTIATVRVYGFGRESFLTALADARGHARA